MISWLFFFFKVKLISANGIRRNAASKTITASTDRGKYWNTWAKLDVIVIIKNPVNSPTRSDLAPADAWVRERDGEANVGYPPKNAPITLTVPRENKILSAEGKYRFLIPLKKKVRVLR